MNDNRKITHLVARLLELLLEHVELRALPRQPLPVLGLLQRHLSDSSAISGTTPPFSAPIPRFRHQVGSRAARQKLRTMPLLLRLLRLLLLPRRRRCPPPPLVLGGHAASLTPY
jgi:hypothetical protein